MWSLDDYKLVFIALGLAGVLLCSLPAASVFLRFPDGERFSELYVLGPKHTAEDYPFNVKAGEPYSIYLGIGNNMGSSTYYVARIKFRNATDPCPNATMGTESSLPVLYERRVFLQDGATWETHLSFFLNKIAFSGNMCWVDSLIVEDASAKVDKLAYWNTQNNGYYFNFFIELYIYRTESDSIEYHERFVGILLNMTDVS